MTDHFSASDAATIDRDNRLMAAAGLAMSQTLNDLYALIATGTIGITAEGKDIDSLALGGGAFGYDSSTSSVLNFGYRSGRVLVGRTVKSVAAGTILLAASNTNYVEVDGTGAGSVVANTTGFTTGRTPLYTVVTGVSTITSVTNAKVLLEAPANAAIVGAMLSTAAATKSIGKSLGTLSATTSLLVRSPPFAATLSGAYLVSNGAVAASDTDYWTFALQDKGAAGTGTTDTLDTTATNTTKATGGAAMVANVARSLALTGTSANLNTAANDVLIFTATRTGAPSNLSLAELVLDFVFAA